MKFLKKVRRFRERYKYIIACVAFSLLLPMFNVAITLYKKVYTNEVLVLNIIFILSLLAVVYISVKKTSLVREFEFFFLPMLCDKNKILFVFIVCLPFILLYFSIYQALFSREISVKLPLDKHLLFNIFQTFLGYILTVIVGFAIALKVSTNNIKYFLPKVALILKESEDEDEVYIMIPTPYLGAFSNKRYNNDICDFITRGRKCHIAYLPTCLQTHSGIEEELSKKYERDKKVYGSYGDAEIKASLWKDFCEENIGGKRDSLLKFHIDELTTLPENQNPKKFDYLIGLTRFIREIEERKGRGLTVYQVDIPYNIEHTVFPILIANVDKNRILQGTVLVESQKSINFVGRDFVNESLAKKAKQIFMAQTKTEGTK